MNTLSAEDMKLADEAIAESTPITGSLDGVKTPLPEAPASANIKFEIEGFEVMLTMRGEKVDAIVNQVEYMVRIAREKGWIPVQKYSGKPKQAEPLTIVPGRKCPKCGSELVRKVSKKTGKPFIKCIQGKYENGMASGCDYVEWL